jgi:hypothetical protein
MQKFKVGDRVRGINPEVPLHTMEGTIVEVFDPPGEFSDYEYEVSFGFVSAIFRQSQMVLTGESLLN